MGQFLASRWSWSTVVDFFDRLGRKFWDGSNFPLWFGFGSFDSSGSCDVDEVLVKEDVKGYVRH